MPSGWNLWVWIEYIGVVSGCCCFFLAHMHTVTDDEDKPYTVDREIFVVKKIFPLLLQRRRLNTRKFFHVE